MSIKITFETSTPVPVDKLIRSFTALNAAHARYTGDSGLCVTYFTNTGNQVVMELDSSERESSVRALGLLLHLVFHNAKTPEQFLSLVNDDEQVQNLLGFIEPFSTEIGTRFRIEGDIQLLESSQEEETKVR